MSTNLFNMKKLSSFLLLLVIVTISLYANMPVKNLFVDYSGNWHSKEDVIHFFKTNNNFPSNCDLVQTRVQKDDIGMTHYTYQQVVNGIKVEGCYLLLHERNGVIQSVNGRLLDKDNIPITNEKSIPKKQILSSKANISDADIEYIIFEYNGKFYRAYKYYDKDKFSNIYIDAQTGKTIVEKSIVNYVDAQGTALTMYYGWKDIVFDNENGQNTLHDNARNIHTVDATYYDGMDAQTIKYFTNSSSKWDKPILSSVTIEWSAQEWWYNALTDTKPDFYIRVLTTDGTVLYKSGYYDDTDLPLTFKIPVFIEANGNIKVEVLDYDGLIDDSAGEVLITQKTAGAYNWNNGNTRASFTITNHPALDVHWGMEKTYDFYKEKFNHISYDNKGSQILQLVNPPSSLSPYNKAGYPNNATALYGGNFYYMAYGIGDGITANPVVTIDIMGHEFTHLVTAANGDQNLPNYGEGGALNESFGDIMGNAIEAYALGEADWLVGKGVALTTENKAGRSLKAPKSMGSPNAYLRKDGEYGGYWRPITGQPTETNDMDGVHTNNGVQNFWFYLLSEGGSGYVDDDTQNDSYSVVGIGMDKAVRIAYRNLMYYITSSSGYYDSRQGSIQAVIDLYGKNSQEYKSVIEAWDAVGVYGDKDITISAKMPDDWGTTISAWTWGEGNTGSWVSLTKKEGRYEYSIFGQELNIIFVNGNTWNGDNNQTVDITLHKSACVSIGDEQSGKRSYTLTNCSKEVTIKAKMPSDWGNTISAWTWSEGNEGSWATLKKEGEWYSYTSTESPLNIVFVNGTNWNGDNNQSVDISIAESACIQLANNTTGKRSYSIVDCKSGIGTSVEETNSSSEFGGFRKLLRDGQILIQNGEHIYTITGQQLE